jgi:hypothetical protein
MLLFQAAIYAELMNDPNDRDILSFVDLVGHCGKTAFVRYMYYLSKMGLLPSKLHDVYIINSMGGTIANTASILKSAFKEGWTGRILLVNFGSAAKLDDIYDGLEAIKDAFITITKYLGHTIDWTPGHLAIFSNMYLDPARMTKGRLKAFRLGMPSTVEGQPEPPKDITKYVLHPMTYTQVKSEIRRIDDLKREGMWAMGGLTFDPVETHAPTLRSLPVGMSLPVLPA